MNVSNALEATGEAPGQPAAERRRIPRPAITTALAIGVVNVVLILVFGLLSRDGSFTSVGSLQNIGQAAALTVVLASGTAFVLGVGQLDVSIGATVILSSVLGAKVIVAISSSTSQTGLGASHHLGVGITAAVATCLATGALVGAVNGFLITRLNINSFIVTLGTLGIATGVAQILAVGGDVVNVPIEVQSDFGVKLIAGVPATFLTAIIIAGALALTLSRTRFGLRTLAIGSSRSAAERAGIPTGRHIFVIFVGMGLLAGLAGWLDVCRFATTNIDGHQTDALAAISGAVIGGTALFGGTASVWGAVMGALLGSILELGLVSIGLPSAWQQVSIGVVLIVAVAIDQYRRAQST